MTKRKTTRALSPCSFYQHGWKLFQHGDLEGARDTLLRSVDVDFDNAAAWGLLARVYESMEEPEHAAEAARQAVRSAPLDPHWCVVSAATLMPLKLFDEARLKLDRAIELNPDHADAYFNRAILDAIQGRTKGALDDLKHALTLDKSLFDVLDQVQEFETLRNHENFPREESA